jgi:uncharacterized protein (DUF4415 family)
MAIEWDPAEAAINVRSTGSTSRTPRLWSSMSLRRRRDRAQAIRGGSIKKEYDFSGGRRGPVARTSPGKTRITIRIDDDVLQWFREQVHAAGGGNYQTLMNAALREHVSRQVEPLEDTLRRVVREELHR